jgi:hypothetical protein
MTFIAKNSGYYASEQKPTAFITKGKQRVKQYSQSVYLNNGDEFEIELFNPTKKTILAKIKINGEYLSEAGLISKPGQRVFLERLIDVDKKLVYSTYEVDGNDKDVQHAIASNGNVEVEFYNEALPNWINTIWLNNTGTSTSTVILGNYPSTYTNTASRPHWQDIGTTVNYSSTPTMDINLTSNSVFSNTSLETGRVESGEKSNQSLIHSNNFTFEWFTFHTVSWKILPNSQKPIEVNDLKRYCHNCGSKIKKSTYKFCPNCGAKLD